MFGSGWTRLTQSCFSFLIQVAPETALPVSLWPYYCQTCQQVLLVTQPTQNVWVQKFFKEYIPTLRWSYWQGCNTLRTRTPMLAYSSQILSTVVVIHVIQMIRIKDRNTYRSCCKQTGRRTNSTHRCNGHVGLAQACPNKIRQIPNWFKNVVCLITFQITYLWKLYGNRNAILVY